MPPISSADFDSQSEFMSACVPEMMESGDRDQSQAVAICLSIWREGKNMKPQVTKVSARGDPEEAPYGDVDYADPGLQEDKKARYPIDTEQHIRAAWNYIAKPDNQKPYTREQVATIKRRIVKAWRAKIDEDGPPGLDDDPHIGKNGKAMRRNIRRKQEPPPVGSKDRDEYMAECLDAMGGGEDAMSACAAAWESAGSSEEEKRMRRVQNRRIKQAAPAVQEDETREEYVSRCREAVAGEDVSDEEANSICEMAWESGSAAEEEKAMRKRWRMKQAPEVGEDEDRSAYLDRCREAVMNDDIDEEEATSVCELAWENKSVSRLRHKTHSGLVNEMEFILSDSTPDRMGDVIASEGWDLTSFKKNPIALFNHRADFPIGRWDDLRVEDGALRGRLRLAPAGTSDRIDEIRKLIEADILRAVSVGFRPIRSQPRKLGEKMIGEYFIKQELVESSLVSVPANPNALAIAKNLDVSDETLDLVFAEHGVRAKGKQATAMSGKHATTTMRTSYSSSAKLGVTPSTGSKAMALAQRISDAQARIVVLRDKLTDHLSNVDDSNVSDAQLELTNELNQRIMQEQKQLSALMESEKFLAQSSEDEARSVVPQRTNGNGNGRTPTMRTSAYSHSRSAGSQMIPNTKEGRFDLIVRAGIIQAFAHRQKIGLDQALAKIAQMYPRYGDEATRAFTEYTSKLEAFPAMTTVPGWAEELVQLIHSDYLELLMPKSVFPTLSNLGLSLSFGRAGRISIPMRDRGPPSIGGSFVGEGEPIPVRMTLFRPLILTPKKLAVITTWTREMDESSIPAIEGVLRNAIQEDTAVAIDQVLLDAMPATVVRPPGLLDGVTLITASTATPPFNAMVEDMKALSGELITNTFGNVRKMVWIMNPQQVLGASLAVMPGVSAFPFKDEVGGGKLLGYPIIESGTVPMGTILAVDAAEFVTVGGEAPRFEISDQATLHMEDDTPLALHDGTTVAHPIRSLWQTDSIGLRLILPLNWAMRRAGCVAGISGVTW